MEKLSGENYFWRKTLIILCLILPLFFIISFQLAEGVLPVTELQEDRVQIEITPGSSSMEIAKNLKEAGLIRNELLFRLYGKIMGYDGSLQAGKYEFSSGLTMGEVLEKIVRGEVIVSTKRITIPEGLNVEQVARHLESQGAADKGVFLEKVKEVHLEDYWFLKEGNDSTYMVEGYLFPDTYEIEEDAAEEDIIKVLLNRFKTVFNDSYRERAEELEMNVHETVTLASIIERETRIKEEQPLVSSVFHNRLERNMLLESCATVQYALGEVKPVLTERELQIESFYNTYIHPGLPPGPIAAPGKSALEAALHPEDTEYFYFVLKGDESGEHYFGKTFSEHQENRRKARREAEE